LNLRLKKRNSSLTQLANYNLIASTPFLNDFCFKKYIKRNKFSFHFSHRRLIANLQPNELGLNENGAAPLHNHFAYTSAQLSKAIDLIGDKRIFTHANFGMNCLSKRNLEEYLRQKMLNFQSQQIDQLMEAEKYLEVNFLNLSQNST
jgi:hypothetical protein